MDQRAASISSSVGLGIILISQFIGLAALFSSALTTNENKHIIQRANAIEENGGDPVECALKIAEKIRKAKITSVVIDTETDFIKLGVAKAVAKAMGATYYSLRSLSQEHILRIVRNLDV